MSDVLFDCTRCGGAKVGFKHLTHWHVSQNRLEALYVCNACRGGVIARFRTPTYYELEVDVEPHEHTAFAFQGLIPRSNKRAMPDHLPPNVANAFEQALDNLQRGQWEGAGMLCRRALDVATKGEQLDPTGDLANLQLAKRIDKLEDRRMITPDLKQWAHHIRRLGNDAAHEDEPFDEQSAREMVEFADLFFRYAFTLPEMMRQRKGATAPALVTVN